MQITKFSEECAVKYEKGGKVGTMFDAAASAHSREEAAYEVIV